MSVRPTRWKSFFMGLAAGMVLGTTLCPLAEAAGTLTLHEGIAAANSAYPIARDHAYAVTLDMDYQGLAMDSVRVGYVNEGHLHELKRDGVFVQGVWSYRMTPWLSTEVFAGPYFTATTVPASINKWRDEYEVAALGGFAVRLDLHKNITGSIGWQHVFFTPNHRDTDIFLIGIGWRP